jgi:hypothetical protein
VLELQYSKIDRLMHLICDASLLTHRKFKHKTLSKLIIYKIDRLRCDPTTDLQNKQPSFALFAFVHLSIA